jgi:hypothetical protein
MVSANLILDAVNSRLEFWREQQQAAFRDGDQAEAAMCDRILEEYAQLAAAAAGLMHGTPPSETFIKGVTDCALI